MKLQNLEGQFPYQKTCSHFRETIEKKRYPQPFSYFPVSIILVMFLSSIFKLMTPFALEYLYNNLTHTNFYVPFSLFLIVIGCSYWFQREGEKMMSLYKLEMKRVLCERIVQASLNDRSSTIKEDTLWRKISSNVNIYVYNYYDSYVNIVFQTFKAVFIVCYLFYQLGSLTIVGLAMSGVFVVSTLSLTKKIQKVTFASIQSSQNKTNILNAYISRIIDYQMSWMDGFVGRLVEGEQRNIQKYLRQNKMLDCWCVGIWQFTQVGISSIVLCLYYIFYGIPSADFQPATIIFFFQMITFPMNAISWNIAGINSALQAISQLNEYQKNGNHTKQPEFRGITYSDRLLIDEQTYVSKGRIYCVEDEEEMKNIMLQIMKLNNVRKVGYARQNGFFLPTTLQTMLMFPQTNQHDLQSYLCRKQQKIDQDMADGLLVHQDMADGLLVDQDMADGLLVDQDMADGLLVDQDMADGLLVDQDMADGLLVDQDMADALLAAQCSQIPLEHNPNTFSGGQKMRVSLARALYLSDTIFIDSDLTSLDKQTRDRVLYNLANLGNKTIFIKCKQFEKDPVLTQITFQKIKNKAIVPNPSCTHQPKIYSHKQQPTQPKLQMMATIARLKNKVFQNSSNQRYVKQGKENEHVEGKENQNVQGKENKQVEGFELSIKTLLYYYKNIATHMMFLISIVGMYAIGNYYNYFINVSRPQDPISHAASLFYITVLYIVFIVLRSYLFAEANLLESQRICTQMNQIVVYNHIQFYGQGPYHQAIKQSQIRQKLLCLANSDESSVSSGFPFITNIFWNNVMTVGGALIMVAFEVPSILVLAMPIIYWIKTLDEHFRKENEKRAVRQKNQQAQMMRACNTINAGILQIQLSNLEGQFFTYFKGTLHKYLRTGNERFYLMLWAKSNYRFIMFIFITSSILFHQLFSHSSNSKASIAVMARYALLLSDYVFHFTISLAESRAKAINIQRIRKMTQNQLIQKSHRQRLGYMEAKIHKLKQTQKESDENKIIELRGMSFKYADKNEYALNDINLSIGDSDRIVIKGKTGAGKTTLFKILTGLYPQKYISNSNHRISFSSQHPLRLPMASIIQNIDPYQIMELVPPQIRNKITKMVSGLIQKQQKSKLSYEDEVKMNNIRAYLYSYNGLTIYDQPQIIPQQQTNKGAYVTVTHHRNFKADKMYEMDRGKLTEKVQ